MQTLCACGCGQRAPIATETNRPKGYVKGQPVRYVRGHHVRVGVHPFSKLNRICIGALNPRFKHGMTTTPEYRAYKAARTRCNNPNTEQWRDYGGRGIKFLFTSFEQFLAELGSKPSPKHTLDRINNDGHYAPGNVRWATRHEQKINQRPRKKAA